MPDMQKKARSNNAKKKHEPRIFSRESSDALSSPEKLNGYIRVVTPGTWILIAALALVMAALIFWGIAGKIPVCLSVKGVGVSEDIEQALLSRQEGDFSEADLVNAIICPINTEDVVSASILDKKQARVVFRDGATAEGTTRLFDSVPHSLQEVENFLSDYLLEYSGWFFSQIEDYDYSYVVIVEIDKPVDLYYWKDVADVSIVTQEIHPISFLFH